MKTLLLTLAISFSSFTWAQETPVDRLKTLQDDILTQVKSANTYLECKDDLGKIHPNYLIEARFKSLIRQSTSARLEEKKESQWSTVTLDKSGFMGLFPSEEEIKVLRLKDGNGKTIVGISVNVFVAPNGPNWREKEILLSSIQCLPMIIAD